MIENEKLSPSRYSVGNSKYEQAPQSSRTFPSLNGELEKLQNELDPFLTSAETAYQQIDKNEFNSIFHNMENPSYILLLGMKIYFCMLHQVPHSSFRNKFKHDSEGYWYFAKCKFKAKDFTDFIQSMAQFKKDHLTESVVTNVRSILANSPNFNLAYMRKHSHITVIPAIYHFVKAMLKYYEIKLLRQDLLQSTMTESLIKDEIVRSRLVICHYLFKHEFKSIA